jgi:peptidoglycan/xylan/chitin deacetylase (PgdA/CDA1 family)
MRLVSPVLHRVLYPALGGAGYFHSRFSSSSIVSVISYHGVLTPAYESRYGSLDNTLVKQTSFRSQLQLLKKNYNVIAPEQFLGWLRGEEQLPDRAVLLTCDDGLFNHLACMLPILQEESLKCLFFVTGGSLYSISDSTPKMLWYMELYLMLMQAPRRDTPLTLQGIAISRISDYRVQRETLWQELMKTLSRLDAAARLEFMEEVAEKLGLPSAWRARQLDDPLLRDRFRLLDLSELRRLADMGMAIGAHTLSHPVLAEQDSEMVRVEISECRQAIEKALRQPVWAIAYPFGTASSVGSREYGFAEAAGYECAFMNVGGAFDRTSSNRTPVNPTALKPALPRFAFPRIHVTAEMSLTVYEAYVSGFHDALRRRFRS